MENNKIHLINLGVLFSYMVIITIMYKDAVLIFSILPIAIQIFVNLMLFIRYFKDKTICYTYLLSAVLVLLIGFPSCWGFSNIGNSIKF